MLRGAQTPGELKQRTDRMHGFPDLAAVHDVLGTLIEREYVARIERRPGQKEERYRHRLSDERTDVAHEPIATGAPATSPPPPPPPPRPAAPEDAERLDRLEAEVAELRREIARLREALGES